MSRQRADKGPTQSRQRADRDFGSDKESTKSRQRADRDFGADKEPTKEPTKSRQKRSGDPTKSRQRADREPTESPVFQETISATCPPTAWGDPTK